jgi:multiple sugar transport system ATP-binding protein
MASIAVEGVSKVYAGGVTALSDLSFVARDGELLVLVGPSGCGKTTTLRLIAGLDRPSRGVIRLGGRDVTHVAPRDRNVAMVFQHHVLYPHMSVYRNMAFGLWLRGEAFEAKSRLMGLFRRRGIPKPDGPIDDVTRLVRQTAKMLGIEGLLGRWPHELSGGERQRVALGRALVRRPAAFLLDEPLASLDAARRADLARELKQLHRQFATTTVLVTHDQSEALSLGDRVAVMRDGTIQQIGPPMAVHDRPRNRFVAGFMGTPPMNILEGEIAEHGEQTKLVVSGHRIALSARLRRVLDTSGRRQVAIGVRPEDVVLGHAAADAGRPAIRGCVTSVEPLGYGDCVHVEFVGRSSLAVAAPVVVARTGRGAGWRVGDPVNVEFDKSRLHVFDLGTGENLALGSLPEAAGPSE